MHKSEKTYFVYSQEQNEKKKLFFFFTSPNCGKMKHWLAIMSPTLIELDFV